MEKSEPQDSSIDVVFFDQPVPKGTLPGQLHGKPDEGYVMTIPPGQFTGARGVYGEQAKEMTGTAVSAE